MIRLITVRGIGENREHNMLSQVVRHFPNTEHLELPWSAVYGPVGGDLAGQSFARATEQGEELLVRELDKGPALVVGYSGGAEVAGNVAAVGHPNLVATGLVADPSAPYSRSMKSGIRGPRFRALFPQPVKWVSNERDVICSCPEDSPLRIIAELSEAFSLGDPAAWGLGVFSKLQQQKMWEILRNPFRIVGMAQRYEDAYRDACGYLGRDPANPSRVGKNHHTDYSLDDLAWWLATKKRDYERNHYV